MKTELNLEIFGGKTPKDNGLDDVCFAIEFVSMSWLEETSFRRAIKGGLGKAFKGKVESTLQGRGWTGATNIFASKQKGNPGGLYYDRLKPSPDGGIAFTWGFHHQQVTLRNIMKPMFHKIDKVTTIPLPSIHIIVAPCDLVRKKLKMNGAQAKANDFKCYLDLLDSNLVLPTALVTVVDIGG